MHAVKIITATFSFASNACKSSSFYEIMVWIIFCLWFLDLTFYYSYLTTALSWCSSLHVLLRMERNYSVLKVWILVTEVFIFVRFTFLVHSYSFELYFFSHTHAQSYTLFPDDNVTCWSSMSRARCILICFFLFISYSLCYLFEAIYNYMYCIYECV